jgi:hypothetical protein
MNNVPSPRSVTSQTKQVVGEDTNHGVVRQKIKYYSNIIEQNSL